MAKGGMHIDDEALPLFLHNGEALVGLLVDPCIDKQCVDLSATATECLCYAELGILLLVEEPSPLCWEEARQLYENGLGNLAVH